MRLWTSPAELRQALSGMSGLQAMLSMIVICGDASAETVVRTLAALVEASMRGLVGDVVLAGAPGTELALIAEHAGCAVIEAANEAEALRQALALVRRDEVMILLAGHIPEAGFLDEVKDLLAVGLTPQRGGRLLRAAPENFLERMFPQLAPAVGLVAARQLCEAAEAAGLRDLINATRARAPLRRRLLRIA